MALFSQLSYVMRSFRDRDRVVNVVTHYGLNSLGTESRWGKTSHTHPDQSWDPPRLLHKGFQGFPEKVKRPKPGVDHPSPSSAKVKESVEIYIYSHSVFVACSKVNFTLI